jgi:hypothetical protein
LSELTLIEVQQRTRGPKLAGGDQGIFPCPTNRKMINAIYDMNYS